MQDTTREQAQEAFREALGDDEEAVQGMLEDLGLKADTHHEIEVDLVVTCNFCDYNAEYDAQTPRGWAYVCGDHFMAFHCSTGTGLGQKLVLV